MSPSSWTCVNTSPPSELQAPGWPAPSSRPPAGAGTSLCPTARQCGSRHTVDREEPRHWQFYAAEAAFCPRIAPGMIWTEATVGCVDLDQELEHGGRARTGRASGLRRFPCHRNGPLTRRFYSCRHCGDRSLFARCPCGWRRAGQRRACSGSGDLLTRMTQSPRRSRTGRSGIHAALAAEQGGQPSERLDDRTDWRSEQSRGSSTDPGLVDLLNEVLHG
jgi:hypothetical protein